MSHDSLIRHDVHISYASVYYISYIFPKFDACIYKRNEVMIFCTNSPGYNIGAKTETFARRPDASELCDVFVRDCLIKLDNIRVSAEYTTYR